MNKNPKIKLVALDMDGTSFIKAGGIVKKNIAPLQEIISMGIKVVFVTGRPIIAELNNDIKKYNLIDKNTIMVGFNGALIRDLNTNKTLSKHIIPKKIVKKVFEIVEEYEEGEVNIWCYLINERTCIISSSLENNTCFEGEARFFDGDIEVYSNETELTNAYKFICHTNNKEFINKIESLGLSFYGTLKKNSEIVLNTTNKGVALQFLCDYYNLKSEEILAVGDGENDVPMLEFAKYSFAPWDSSDKALKAAKYISDTSYVKGAVGKILCDFITGGEID